MYEAFTWIFGNVILALLPIYGAFFCFKAFYSETTWFELIEGGELFIYSSTICASSLVSAITNVIVKSNSPPQPAPIPPTPESSTFLIFISIAALIIMSLLSALAFGAAIFFKKTNTNIENKKSFGKVSLWFAALSTIFSFFAFWQY